MNYHELFPISKPVFMKKYKKLVVNHQFFVFCGGLQVTCCLKFNEYSKKVAI